MTKMRRLTAKEVEKILRKCGFELISQKGSHRKWRNLNSGLQVIVPDHKGKILPIGTLRNIVVGADLPEKEWKD
jgi:predicted RNA binding protein YcfA (HicA-like mRNA interferase family)